jgi:ABC-2 type transport system permease protein
MRRAFRAELVKIVRARVLIVVAVGTAVFAVGGAALVISAAEPAAAASRNGVTLESLSQAGGGTEVFRRAASFAGFFVFVVFVGAVAIEFGRGTFRTMLLRQPRRLQLLVGKMSGLLAFAGLVVATAMPLAWVAARLIAPSNDIDTADWISFEALGAGIGDYAAVVLWMTGYALLGMTLAVLVRSVPIAMGVGIAWAGPAEHVIVDAFDSANQLFPGLLLEAFASGGTTDVSASRAFVTIAGYVMLATAIAAVSFARRDVAG